MFLVFPSLLPYLISVLSGLLLCRGAKLVAIVLSESDIGDFEFHQAGGYAYFDDVAQFVA